MEMNTIILCTRLNEMIKKAISGKREDCCEYYHTSINAFLKKNKKLKSSDREKLELLSSISSFVFHPYNIDASPIYGPLMVVGNQRSKMIDDLTDADLSRLEEISNEIDNLELKARICDILWLKKNDYKFAVCAIGYFIKRAHYFTNKESQFQKQIVLKTDC